MYTRFFGLTDKPFSITPDPRYLFMSERHGEALAHLVYGVTESGGFIQLTGEVGTGKTTLVRSLLQNRLPDNADVAVVLNPQLTAIEFLATVVEELSVEGEIDPTSTKSLTDALNRYLLRAHADGRRVILIVDEAQNLAPGVLEQVRLLTNLETAKQKLLQIILIGQPELRELLSRIDLRQLAQRITGRYHLEPLSRDETAQYIRHRMRVAGALTPVFTDKAIRTVFRLTEGVPRLINVICDRSLLAAYAVESPQVTPAIVRRAAAEVRGEEDLAGGFRILPAAAVVATVAILFASVAWVYQTRFFELPTTVQTAELPADARASEEESGETAVEAAAPETVVDASPPQTPSLHSRLLDRTPLDGNAAFNELAALWGYDTVADCTAAVSVGLSCVSQRAAFGTLRQLDRPAVLELVDRDGGIHRVLLKALRESQAVLSIGGEEIAVPVSELTEYWLGEFQMLWRPPNGRAVALLPGVRDENVVWLRESLAAIDGRYRTGDTESDLYSDELVDRVRAFQRDQRLMVDGLAGAQTQIIINGLIDPAGAPTLATARLAGDL